MDRCQIATKMAPDLPYPRSPVDRLPSAARRVAFRRHRVLALSERTITITGAVPVEVLGANDQNLRIIRELFPKLNILARGDTVKVTGADADVDAFAERFDELVKHVERYHDLVDTLEGIVWSALTRVDAATIGSRPTWGNAA